MPGDADECAACGRRKRDIRRMRHGEGACVLDAQRAVIEMAVLVRRRRLVRFGVVSCGIGRADRRHERGAFMREAQGRGDGRHECSGENRKTCDPGCATFFPFLHFGSVTDGLRYRACRVTQVVW